MRFNISYSYNLKYNLFLKMKMLFHTPQFDVNVKPNVHFIFVNTPRFYNHSHIHYIEK